MDFEAGPFLPGRWLSGSQLRSSEILRKRSEGRRFLPERGEPADGGLLQKQIRIGTSDHFLSLELRAIGIAIAVRAAGMVRGDDSPAYPHVSHGTLRVLRFSIERHGLHQLRAAIDRKSTRLNSSHIPL